ncbi:glutamate synthase large subunit [Nitriliruptor alkaliphilus]|uniref:glutamate synthase large subunit n=1 Tax=Nitriliruptor alkaliphilus TaxID=427918 RepID=UPI000695AAA9|nr:glutamate synthase large subunit [Nitriliruptor alkaliphilus]
MSVRNNVAGEGAAAQGLYDPAFEHDACGVAFVVDVHGRRSHEMVQRGLTALHNLDHRGATGAEDNVGDGAGILIQVPDAFLREVCEFPLPPAGTYAIGAAFLPQDPAEADAAAKAVDAIVADEGLRVVGWRDIPVDNSAIGSMARDVEPTFRHLVVAAREGDPELSGLDLERRAFVLRKRIEHEIGTGAPAAGDTANTVYFPSLSGRTLVYKGMLTSTQLGDFFLDLRDERLDSALALVHSRFSTNTFPSWPLAHPYRVIAHNGEINTVMGNRNWMRAREGSLSSPLFGDALERALPIMTPGASDTASFDECLELLHLGGRSLPHAVLMMIPEAWENHESMSDLRRDFYGFHSAVMEPWDGPASIAFTDGTVIGAVLDRNGLRPSRYWVTEDGLVVMASEVGVLDIDPASVVTKGRLQPGRMFLVDTAQGRIVDDEELKAELAGAQPYGEWLADGLLHLEDLPDRDLLTPQHASIVKRQRTFGYTSEEIRVILAPMARMGYEPIGSMGTDTPIAVLSERSRLLFDYFSQLFAQVTNPPLDAIREELVTSMAGTIGPEGNLLEPGPDSCKQIVLPKPVLSNEDLAKILYIDEDGENPGFKPFAIDGLYPVAEGGDGMRRALDEVCAKVSAAIEDGARIVVLSDRYSNAELAPIPSLLLTAAVHHHLIREKTRTKVGLVVEAGDAREVHHMALLIGYGAAAINPYLAFETIDDLIREGILTGIDHDEAVQHYVDGCTKGVLKIMSKMGISTVASYTGAQVFEAVGLSQDLVDRYFVGTSTKLGGIGLDQIAEEVAQRHRFAYLDNPEDVAHRDLWVGGEYQWRREGELHLFNPATVFKLQHATREKRYEVFKEYTELVDGRSAALMTLRGLFGFKDGVRPPVPLDEVEPVSEIVKRFSTGAMSYGSISAEAHETLAVAMNRLGGKSNTGEGGEDPDRFTPDEDGDLRRSAIKQVASGRFGVTAEYLTNADDIQIKMAQGAKPGEGGQLPGQKVWPWIAKTRYSTPGVGLISPPPHHDIYSIEDLKQLIHDLKNANPSARVHVKLVAEVGVGTVAAGVSKAKADVVLISGHDGGTGASPLNSLKHAGGPWELGLAETQQTLLMNGLRDRIVVQVDGQLKTGRDVVVAALLGAEEFGFATAPLVVSGCIMMRVCHLDTCPVGVATQNPELRAKFSGKPEFVVTFFEYIAEEVRELLAQLGFRTLDEAIGAVDALDIADAVEHWKAKGLDLSPILHVPTSPWEQDRYNTKTQDHGLDKALDNQLIELAEPALERGESVTIERPIANLNRTVGTLLGHELTKRYGGLGLPDDTIDVTFRGSAGQSFGAFVPRGVTLRLHGDANDFVGKGLSGGKLVIRPPDEVHPDFVAEDSIVAGNVMLYGATGGHAYVRGVVGERFCVRNSGATAVVEGVGDHGCEYMTGGRAVVLGETGRNFGAGMSGGIGFVYDPEDRFHRRVNLEMVDLDPLDEADKAWLRDEIRTHLELTGSAVAQRLLQRWHREVRRFVKVMPRDYKRVLEARRLAEEEGRDVDEAIMASARG